MGHVQLTRAITLPTFATTLTGSLAVSPIAVHSSEGSNPEYIDKNYGNLLIIWDRLFGTFEPEKAKVTYGLVNNVNTFNPIKITLMDWQAMLREIKEKEKVSEKIKIFFGAPQTKVKI